MMKLVPRTPSVMPGAENLTACGVALAILPEMTDKVPRLTVASMVPAWVDLALADLDDTGFLTGRCMQTRQPKYDCQGDGFDVVQLLCLL